MFHSFVQLESLAFLTLTALTSALPSDVLTLNSVDGVVVGSPFPTCGGSRPHKPLNVPVDSCFSTPTLALKITTPAICANGTRAKWARFPEKGCGYGTLDSKFGLVDLEDSDIGDCMLIGEFKSMAFWCDGVEKSSPPDDKDDDEKEPEDDRKDKSTKGTTSESACMPRKAPFWKHTYGDKCSSIHYHELQVSKAAICANGTQSTLALYKNDGCFGQPSEFRTVEESDNNECKDVGGMQSYAWYCSGEEIGGPEPIKNQGSLGGFLLILFLIFLILMVTLIFWLRKIGEYVGFIVRFVRVSCPLSIV